jgi:hypothetical protein
MQNAASNREGATPTASQASSRQGRDSTSDDGVEPVVEDEYFRRLTAGLPSGKAPERLIIEDPARFQRSSGLEGSSSVVGRKASSELHGLGSSAYAGGDTDEDDSSEKREGAFRVITPRVAHVPELHRGVRVKSSEGLLRDALAQQELGIEGLDREGVVSHAPDDSEYVTTPEQEHPRIHRATSVKTKKIAADDAKLVEVGKKPLAVKDSTPNAGDAPRDLVKEIIL